MNINDFNKECISRGIPPLTDELIAAQNKTLYEIQQTKEWKELRESIDMTSPKTLNQLVINNLSLPIEVVNDCDYLTYLYEAFSIYREEIYKQKSLLNDSVIINLDKNIQTIKNALQHYYNAEVIQAQKCINDMIAKYLNDPFLINGIDKSYAFRGIAPEYIAKGFGYEQTNSELYKEMNEFPLSFFKARVSKAALLRHEMLHIPFNKRELVTTQRFSMPGVPCLYLGTTSLDCWLELNEPKHKEFYCSAYKIPSNLKVLNLCINYLYIDGKCASLLTLDAETKAREIASIQGLIELFPLVIATSFKVKNDNRKFKSEYIISQLLMQVIKGNGIDGIAYFSKRMLDYYALWHCVNLAILATCDYISNEQEYFALKNEIELTTPVSFKDWENVKESTITDDHRSFCNHFFRERNPLGEPKENNLVILNNKQVEYIQTEYSQFDEFLLKQPFSKITIMKEIKHKIQNGPTCGIYAIVMLINTLFEDSKTEPIDENSSDRLASKILDIAIDNGYSKIGELLTISAVTKVLDAYNEKDSNNKLSYSIVEFNSIKDFKDKSESSFMEGKYILFPYYASDGFVKVKKNPTSNDMRHTHWGILYQNDDKKLYCQQGNSSGKQFSTFEKLYESNNTLSEDFFWDEYFSRFNISLELRPCPHINELIKWIRHKKRAKKSACVKSIKDKTSRSKEKKAQLRGESIKIDLSGKMLLIEKYN